MENTATRTTVPRIPCDSLSRADHLMEIASAFARYELDRDEFYTQTAAYSAEQIATVLGIPVTIVNFERTAR